MKPASPKERLEQGVPIGIVSPKNGDQAFKQGPHKHEPVTTSTIAGINSLQ
jgi:hypothetical protein